jgi:hypothetical protein
MNQIQESRFQCTHMGNGNCAMGLKRTDIERQFGKIEGVLCGCLEPGQQRDIGEFRILRYA